MEVQTTAADALEIGKVFAEAYAAADYARLEPLLSPDVVERALVRGELLELHGPGGVIEDLRDFLESRDRYEVLDLQVTLVGHRVLITNHWRLRKSAESWALCFYMFCDVEDGRVEAIDCLCSGPVRESQTGG